MFEQGLPHFRRPTRQLPISKNKVTSQNKLVGKYAVLYTI